MEAESCCATPVRKYGGVYLDGAGGRREGAYLLRCTGCVKDGDGNVVEVLCEYDPDSRGGDPADGRKVKGATIHWVDAASAVDAEVRLYENLIDEEKGVYNEDGSMNINPDSLTVTQAKVEPALAGSEAYESFQFVRNGFFCVDAKDSRPDALVFNRIVSLKSSFKLPKQN